MTFKEIVNSKAWKTVDNIFLILTCTVGILLGIIVLGVKWEWFGNHLLDFVLWLGL